MLFKKWISWRIRQLIYPHEFQCAWHRCAYMSAKKEHEKRKAIKAIKERTKWLFMICDCDWNAYKALQKSMQIEIDKEVELINAKYL